MKLCKLAFKRLRPKLSERELFILDQRLLSDHPLTLKEIAQRYSVSSTRIKEIEDTVMKKIKSNIQWYLKGFFERISFGWIKEVIKEAITIPRESLHNKRDFTIEQRGFSSLTHRKMREYLWPP